MKVIPLLLVFTCICTTSFIAPPLNPFEDGLVAYYSFNSCDARDDSGNESHGKLMGSIDCWCGVEDDGLLLDGIGDYIEFHGSVNHYFNTSDFTISFYFKSEKYSIFQQSLLSKRAECDQYNMFDLLLDMNKKEVNTAVHESPGKFYPRLSPSITPTGWQHFALVREGFTATTYINGHERNKGFKCSGVDISNSKVLSFSNSPCIGSSRVNRFKGVLDELRVYDRALSSEEILQLYSLYPIENAQMDCFTSAPEIMESPIVSNE